MTEPQCYLCSDSDPAFVCFCREVLVCRSCISQHLLTDPSPTHKPIPLTRPELIKAQREEARAQAPALHSCLSEDRRAGIKALLARELDRLHSFEVSAEETLLRTQQQWEDHIKKATADLLLLIKTKAQSMREELSKVAEDLDEGISKCSPLLEWLERVDEEYELLTLVLEVKGMDLAAVLRSTVSVVVERKEELAGNPIIYKFFGGSNQVGVFDAKSESFTRSITSNLKFFHNSCSCLASNGLIYVTGGSLTGRSRSDVLSFDPVSGRSVELQPMQIARRSHSSLCLGSELYVFGGIMDEEITSLCEKYNYEKDCWSSMAKLIERRAYHGSCEHRSKVYVAGGSEKSSCEVLDPCEDQFRLLVLSHVLVEGGCSIVPVADMLLLFYGNFRGEVCRFWPESGQAAKDKDMCAGNSWSSCTPVCAGGFVYMLRAESIFKFCLENSASAYVLRMGKASKRRFEMG